MSSLRILMHNPDRSRDSNGNSDTKGSAANYEKKAGSKRNNIKKY